MFLELFWGGQCVESRSFAGAVVRGAADDSADMPLWGFDVRPGGVRLAEQDGARFRLFAPSGASIERDGARVAPDGQPLTLVDGDVVRFASDAGFSLVARVEPPLPVPPTPFLAAAPVLTFALAASLAAVFAVAVWFAPSGDGADYVPKNLSPVAVRLIAPEPKLKEVAKKKLEQLTQRSKETVKRPAKPAAKPMSFAKAPALKSLQKLSAAGPAMKDLLAAVDKLGGGPGVKDQKHKLSDLIGKQPLANNAGLGTFGLGGGGSGGSGTKGLEVLRGKGGGGIGALGAGNIGRGQVGGVVSRATARTMSASGSIDREAVAKVINSHLAEVSACYERALLRDPGLAGKIVLEWGISTGGQVTSAKTKSSTMKSSAVEACILTALKTWRFPAARGAGVVISYPFLFNSVGY